jgi:uncharacterized UBP type Zn finger protein
MQPGPPYASGTVKPWKDVTNLPPVRPEETMTKHCTHFKTAKITDTATDVCEECVKMGDDWVHLRLCMECGHVGCCDSSKNKHATKHFHRTKHPVIRSIEPGETWTWCYIDEVMGELSEGS